MPSYELPVAAKSPKLKKKQIQLIANGDLRLTANQKCWPEQAKMESALKEVIRKFGYDLVRAHPYKEEQGHGFIQSQKDGMEVFRTIDPKAPIIIAESVWQYSHHVLHGLISHEGPILTAANFSGTWPGLVGMLNLNGSLTKAGVEYSTIWSEDFTDDFFKRSLHRWLRKGRIRHDASHVTPLRKVKVRGRERKVGEALAKQLGRERAILGVFDEGCMGMFNAIIPDHLLNPTGVFKERLSQSALYHETTHVPDDEARAVREWMEQRGMNFVTGTNDETDLTD